MRLVYLFLIKHVYQRWLTKYTGRCWQRPTCSQYAYEAIRDFGVTRGLEMAVARLQSCTEENRNAALNDPEHPRHRDAVRASGG